MMIFYVVILSSIAVNQITAEKFLKLEESFNQKLVDDLLNSYREFGAAEVILSQVDEEGKAECNRQKKLYAETLTKIFKQKREQMSEYTGVTVKGEEKPLPILNKDEAVCRETVKNEFYQQYITDFVHDNFGKVGLNSFPRNPEEIMNRLKDLDEYQIFQRNLESLQNHVIILNTLNSQHVQMAKDIVVSTTQQVLKTKDTVTDTMFKAIDYFMSKQSIPELTDDFHSKVKSAVNTMQQKTQTST